MLLRVSLLNLITLFNVDAHGSPSYNLQQEYSEPIPSEFNGSWEKWHMKVEHDLDSFTPDSFFQIHATTNKDVLSKNDVLRMYGLQRDEVVGQGNGLGSHDNSEVISPELKDRVLTTILTLMDKNNDGEISIDEWRDFSNNGGEFPDFGVGPGHEFDFEEEYEKHHWLLYHADEDPDVEIMHKEDIEHELLHHFHEIEHEDGHDHGKGKDTNHKIHTARFELHKDKIPRLFRAS